MKRSGIYQVTIPEPCHEHWNNMTPAGKGRHCQACDKVVVDFTGMKDEDLVRYLLAHKNVCGRLKQTQVHRPLYIVQPRKKNYWPAIAAMIVAGIFQLNMGIYAQVDSTQLQRPDTIQVDDKTLSKKSLDMEKIMIKGIVKDDVGELVPFANMSVEMDGRTIAGVTADIDGNFILLLPWVYLKKELTIKCSAIGLNTLITKFAPGTLNKSKLIIELKQADVTIVGFILIEPGERVKKGFTTDEHIFDRNDLMTFPR